MNARDLDNLAKRWERQNAAPLRRRRNPKEIRADAAWERWKAESGSNCVPCILEELE